jgi:mono/diheme cytochrome c family protein
VEETDEEEETGEEEETDTSDEGDDTSGDTDTAHDTAAADPGAALYTANCTLCHGEDGKLGVDGAADLTVKVPTLTDAAITDVVQNGKKNMPAIPLTDAEMVDLLAHLRATFGGPPAP